MTKSFISLLLCGLIFGGTACAAEDVKELILPGTQAKAVALAMKDLAKRGHEPSEFDLLVGEKEDSITIDAMFYNPSHIPPYAVGGPHYKISKSGDRILSIGHWR